MVKDYIYKFSLFPLKTFASLKAIYRVSVFFLKLYNSMSSRDFLHVKFPQPFSSERKNQSPCIGLVHLEPSCTH